jgi:hypothetical protein
VCAAQVHADSGVYLDVYTPTASQFELLLHAVDEMIAERQASPELRVRQEAEILQIFRAQLVVQQEHAAA